MAWLSTILSTWAVAMTSGVATLNEVPLGAHCDSPAWGSSVTIRQATRCKALLKGRQKACRGPRIFRFRAGR